MKKPAFTYCLVVLDTKTDKKQEYIFYGTYSQVTKRVRLYMERGVDILLEVKISC